MTDPSQVDVDHVVPLANAWRSGSAGRSVADRAAYANDPEVLLSADARANRAKGDKGPEFSRAVGANSPPADAPVAADHAARTHPVGVTLAYVPSSVDYRVEERSRPMKAVQFAEYGGPEVLRLVEVDEPHAGSGQVRIAVRAAGVNGIDWKIRAGYMSGGTPLSQPSGTGIDAAGVVDEVGEDAGDVAIGDAVFGSGSATFAEHAVLSSWAVNPDGLSFEEAAGYPIPVETAIRILDQVGVQPGETLLVSGASGGVGSAVVQIARQRGIDVIGTASGRNQDYLRSLGAVPTTYDDGLVDRVRDLAPEGIDAALDIAGSGVVPELIGLTGDPSRVLSIADFSAPEHGAQVSTNATNTADALAEAARLFTEGAFRIPVEKTFPLEEAAEAQRASEAGHAAGKFVVTVP